MVEIADEILEEFKEDMKISHKSEDNNLKRLLSSSHLALKEACGEFDLNNEIGKELVFNRARYAYNDSLEFFDKNFLSGINNFALMLAGEDQE